MVRGPSIVRRFAYVVLALVVFSTFYSVSIPLKHSSDLSKTPSNSLSRLRIKPDHESLLLNEQQCQVAFPMLTKEVDDAVAAGPFQFNRSTDEYSGQTHAKIKGGKVGFGTLYLVRVAEC